MSELDADGFLSIVDSVQRTDPALTRLEAAMIAALTLRITNDTKSFARIFGVEHAIALRDLQSLADRGAVAVIRKDARTLRTWYALTASAN